MRAGLGCGRPVTINCRVSVQFAGRDLDRWKNCLRAVAAWVWAPHVDVCVYVRVYTQTCMYTYLHINIYMCVCVCIHIYIYMHIGLIPDVK